MSRFTYNVKNWITVFGRLGPMAYAGAMPNRPLCKWRFFLIHKVNTSAAALLGMTNPDEPPFFQPPSVPTCKRWYFPIPDVNVCTAAPPGMWQVVQPLTVQVSVFQPLRQPLQGPSTQTWAALLSGANATTLNFSLIKKIPTHLQR